MAARTTRFADGNFDSAGYAANRPTYPQALFDAVFAFHRRHRGAGFDLAVDVATGTGQTALDLASSFAAVVGTDSSEAMLRSAVHHDRISYQCSPAERMPPSIASGSVDLITVSTAAHWFDMPAFYAEAHRVLKPSGTVAIWAYLHLTFDDHPELTRLHHEYGLVTMHDYWDRRRDRLDRAYTDADYLQTPFAVSQRILAPEGMPAVAMRRRWSIRQIAQYLRTWSCYKTYVEQHPDREDPADAVCRKLLKAAGTASADTEFNITFPLVLLMAKKAVTD
ncbi:hypothetical protein HK105_207221 [Polyrhizophydium stewartii]|uniref:Methyltransferase type 11 domain-containing protein n=1 Tax=Polyrhizophydium stewartii TaxID=2732419 RepID=A0ABR4MWR3_9FUNG|nr:hypothetical protein HK105_004138 [Polyrhizophydium stewartii]